MSQQLPENSDSQQPDANSTQQADISTPQNVVQGHQNRDIQGNENQGVLGDSNTVVQGNNSTQNIHITNYYYREDIRVAAVQPASDALSDEKLPCPYRGLFHFSPDDAEYFFGREVFIEELFRATQTRNFIPVLGASGSGKSSVVLAGLVPKLQQEGHWLFTHFRPGSNPFYGLAEALVPLYTPDLDDTDRIAQTRKLSNYFCNGDVLLVDVIAKIQQNHPNNCVLLIADQFEELFTLCKDEKIRRSFLDCLLTIIQSPTSKSLSAVFVATMRVDFLSYALSYPEFADQLKPDIKIRSMNRSELTDVIAKPAQKLKVTFQDGLIERILDDVKSEPGILPLLEFALTLLWEKRTNQQLTHAAYEAIGEVQGALATHADTIYKNLNAATQQQISRIFIQLVRPGEGTEDTRRVATKAELGEENWSLVQDLADARARLVVTSRNADGQETVEVVHEALIRNWGKLQQWMNADRNFRAWQERLRSVMYQWEQTQRDEGALLRGAALAEAEEKLKEHPEELIAERAFIEESIQERNRLEQEKADRRRRDVITAWRITGGSLLAVIISCGLWLRAGYQQKQAELNLADSLVRNSLSLFAEHKELEAFVDAIKAGKILQKHKETNPEVINSLIKFVYEGSEYNRLEGHDSGIFSISFSPNGKVLASLSSDEIIKLWDRETGREIRTLKGYNESFRSVSFSPDGKILAAGGDKNILLWDVETGKEIGTLKGHNGNVSSLSFSPDGRILAAGGYGNNILLWDVETREEISTLKGHNETVSSLSFSSDGRILAAGGDKNIHLWDIKTKEKILTLKGNYEYSGDYNRWTQHFRSVSFSPNGKILASGGYNKNILLWDVEKGKEIGTLKGHNETVSSLSFSPDGKILASGSNGDVTIEQPQGEIFIPSSGKIKLWNVEIEKATKTIYKTPGIFISFISNAKALAVNLNKRIEVWDVDTGEQIKIISTLNIFGGHSVINFSPDGRFLARADHNKYIKLKKLKTGAQIISLSGKYINNVNSFSFSYDNKLLASAGGSAAGYYKGTSGYVNLWNIDTKEEIWTDFNFPYPINNTSFSPNGRFLAFISNQYINLLEIKTKKLIKKKIEGITLGTVYKTSFSPNGKILALLNSSSSQETIVLLDVENGRKIATFNVKGRQLSVSFPPQGLSFSPDGKILAFGRPYFVQFWSLDLDSLINRTCVRVRNYLHYNPDVKEEDRNLCDGIGDQK